VSQEERRPRKPSRAASGTGIGRIEAGGWRRRRNGALRGRVCQTGMTRR
jgi:hypothetical protein